LVSELFIFLKSVKIFLLLAFFGKICENLSVIFPGVSFPENEQKYFIRGNKSLCRIKHFWLT